MYTVNEINKKAEDDPVQMIARAENRYSWKIEYICNEISANLSKNPMVLMSGPSSSGKTTTAGRIAAGLEAMGIGCKTISLDDYYKNVDEHTPRNEQGEYDFENPLCLDVELINKHMQDFIEGRPIEVPQFSFPMRKRSDTYREIRLSGHEAVLIEGIHALNPDVTGEAARTALSLYVRVASEVYDDDGLFFPKNLVRLSRRIVRDARTRNTKAAETIAMWSNVRAGEHKYVVQGRKHAKIELDTFLEYELNALKPYILRELGENDDRYSKELRTRFSQMRDMPCDSIPGYSILREFIG